MVRAGLEVVIQQSLRCFIATLLGLTVYEEVGVAHDGRGPVAGVAAGDPAGGVAPGWEEGDRADVGAFRWR
jgi:hypothetical protein